MTDEPKKKPTWRTELSLKRVSNILGLSERTVERMVEEGKLSRPRHKAGGQRVWFYGDVVVYRWRFLRGDFEPGNAEGTSQRRKPASE